ncbi:hypothetical protein GCK72_023745 [Caenorhabditis remanei]|uniref:Uncharacterized protein n=2 Tax=Caenorhabditis remanei TaxID=31234 RepID=E3M2S9_CAERE|nr:hypothetical protein GCK72_023745 [Caenorhabditis remanei]EFO89662.1 hypothetical protein CRE_07482 [Caenorhabditis remanei]KAF1747283.1 hypothetical protein GCK72_023745 [Caenorhabditis remanei]
MFCKLYNFFNKRFSNIPYTPLAECSELKSSKMSQPELESSSAPPSPFGKFMMLKKKGEGNLATFGILSIGISLAGVVILMGPERMNNIPDEEANAKRQS